MSPVNFVYCESAWEYEQALEALWGARRLALDIETYGPEPYADDRDAAVDPHRGRISLIQLKADGGPVYVLDWLRLRDGVSWEPLLGLLKGAEQVVIHNAAFELRFLRAELGLRLGNACCTLLAAQLVSNATGSKFHRQCGHGLDDLLRDYLGVHLQGKGSLQVSSWRVRPLSAEKLAYAAADVEWLLPLWDLLVQTLTNPLPDGPLHPRAPKEMDKPMGLGMGRALQIELEALPAFATMQLNGMPANRALLDYYYEQMGRRVNEAALRAGRLLGLPEDPPDLFTGEVRPGRETLRLLNCPVRLAERLRRSTRLQALDNAQTRTIARLQALFEEVDELGAPHLVGEERQRYQGLELLEEGVREANKQLLQAIIEYKRCKKALDIDLRRYINRETGCIHPNLRQIGASTGRSSCKGPNLQQINAKAAVSLPFGEFLNRLGLSRTGTDLDEAKFSLSQRECFVAPPGYVMVSCDYSSQELLVMAALSQDEVMLRAFTAPKTLVVDGVEYPNPDADLHVQNAANCCYPHLFQGQPKHLWDAIARDKSLTGTGVSARQRGKVLSYGTAYMQGARTMAEQNFVELEEAERWLENHRKAFRTFHRWAERLGKLGVAQGWLAHKLGTIRFVDEDNAKGEGESPARSAVNFAIQGLCAAIGKLALARLLPLVEERGGKLLSFVHDEVVFLLPGEVHLVPERCKVKDGYIVPYWQPSAEVAEGMQAAMRVMADVETEVLDGVLPGEVSGAAAPYWLH